MNNNNIQYIPRREYSPGPDRKYLIVFVDDKGTNDIFYVDMDSVDPVLSDQRKTLREAFRQVRVIHEESEPGIKGVETVPVRGESRLLGKITRELIRQKMNRPGGEK